MKKIRKLEKALGDWKKEGYTLHVKKHPSDSYYFQIHAHDKDGNKVGHAEFIHSDNGKTIESYDDGISFDETSPKVIVRPQHQKKGLGTAMYQMAEQATGKKIRNIRAKKRTTAGQALWNQKNRPFGKTEEITKSQARLTFPNFPKTSTRPDQQVKEIDPNKKFSTKSKTFTQQALENKKVAQKAVGTESPVQRQGIESEINQQMQANPIEGGYNINFGNVNQPYRVKAKNTGLETANVGRNANATNEHEAAHYNIADLGQKYHLPEDHLQSMVKKMVSHLHPDDYKAIKKYLTRPENYNPEHKNLDEEILMHTRDFLTDPNMRSNMEFAGINADKSRLKNSWNNIVKFAHNLTPENFHEQVGIPKYEVKL